MWGRVNKYENNKPRCYKIHHQMCSRNRSLERGKKLICECQVLGKGWSHVLQKQLDKKLMLVKRVHFTQLGEGVSLLYNCFQGDKEE